MTQTEKIDKVIQTNLLRVVKEKDVTFTGESLLKEDLALDSISLIALFTGIGRDLKVDLSTLDDADLVEIHRVKDVKKIFVSQAARTQ